MQFPVIASVEKHTKNRGQQTDSRGCEDCTSKSGVIQTLESQVQKLQSENSQYEERLAEVTKTAAEAKATGVLQHETDLASLRSETQQMQKRKELTLRQKIKNTLLYTLYTYKSISRTNNLIVRQC